MKAMKSILTCIASLFVWFAALPVASGAIGQTPSEIEATLGRPSEVDQKAAKWVWKTDDGIVYSIEVDSDGKSWNEEVTAESSDDADIHKVLEKLRTFATRHLADTEWEMVDASSPRAFGKRELTTVHGVVYWRVSKDGTQAYAMHVSGTPLIGVISPAYATAHPKAPIFAGY